jgi:CRP-like cAMP-binding protein
VSETDLKLLRSAGVESTFPAGQILIERGQPGSGVFVIVEGEVVVEASEGSLKFGPDAVIGERALLSADGKRQARVRALTDVRVVAVTREMFDELCAGDPGFAGRIGT